MTTHRSLGEHFWEDEYHKLWLRYCRHTTLLFAMAMIAPCALLALAVSYLIALFIH
jgi:hypothetical protein